MKVIKNIGIIIGVVATAIASFEKLKDLDLKADHISSEDTDD